MAEPKLPFVYTGDDVEILSGPRQIEGDPEDYGEDFIATHRGPRHGITEKRLWQHKSGLSDIIVGEIIDT